MEVEAQCSDTYSGRSEESRMVDPRVVVPIFNDWSSFCILLRDLDRVFAETRREFSVIAVDDGSTDDPSDCLDNLGPVSALSRVRIVKLATNLGHQRAIAVGLTVANEDLSTDAVIVMDGDGEDRPEDALRLLGVNEREGNSIVVATRLERSETFSFKLLYFFYKMTFAILTGRKIKFGNFSLIPRQHIRRLVMMPDLWNNLPAALIRSRLPLIELPTKRGRRYAGTSKMNCVSLIVFGLSGISVFTDVMFVRMLILTGGLLALGTVATGVVAAMRALTNFASPGWATTVVFGFIIVIAQASVSTLTVLLLLLNGRSQRTIIPRLDCKQFILSVTELPIVRAPSVSHAA
jgi:polyisoprenyl-phosphate glycosyltransferase